MVLTVGVVDDEPLACAALRELLREHSHVEIVWEAGSLSEAENLLRHSRLDVLFVDVRLRGATGFDLLPKVPTRTEVVFVSAHDEYAIRAFEVNALDYLLKPVSRERLAQTLERIQHHRGTAEPKIAALTGLQPEDRILVSSGGRREFVLLSNLAAVTAVGGNYTQLWLADRGSLEVRRTIKEWEAVLPEAKFVRVHRGAIVNVAHLQRMGRESGGTILVRMRNVGDPIKVSRRHARKLNELLDRHA